MKRLTDVTISLLAIVILTPLLLCVYFAVLVFLGSPVIFRQARPGLNGAIFQMYKFRTMRDAFDPQGKPLPDSQRMTRFGRLLRSTSLDELPELWNVIKGDMSLVGPRPLLIEYLPLYSPQQARRHEVRPGITGWAQVNGRNAISWEQKFALDVWYVDHTSWMLDLKILFMTVGKVLSRGDISSAQSVTAEKFTGSPVSQNSGGKVKN